MDNLTSIRPFSTFPSGLGKRAGKLSLEATKMSTRILSVFSLLKRVGFAVLLLGRSIEAAVIENSTEDIMKKLPQWRLWGLLCFAPCPASELLYGTYLGGNNWGVCCQSHSRGLCRGSNLAMSANSALWRQSGRPFCSHFGPDGVHRFDFTAICKLGRSGPLGAQLYVSGDNLIDFALDGWSSVDDLITPDAFDTVIGRGGSALTRSARTMTIL
ncbi:MAG: hypothetical protein IPH10_11630 [bacterium]|nr:hypothetical protein [bacterium]